MSKKEPDKPKKAVKVAEKPKKTLPPPRDSEN